MPERPQRETHAAGEETAQDRGDEGTVEIVDRTNLAARYLGATVVAASDESFGDKENLLRPEAAIFEPGHYGNRGEIVDGWETRRRRLSGHDWAIVRLGAPGVIRSVDVDTSFFAGNHPESCRIEACGLEGYPGLEELGASEQEWHEIVRCSPLKGNDHNVFDVRDETRFSHLRLSVYPDGGVARLRVLGVVVPDPRLFDGVSVDLASESNGGEVVASSDEFYSSARHLIRPDAARDMGEGWETRRRRDSGHDFVVLRLGASGCIRHLVVDTSHFRYNASSAVAAYGSSSAAVPSLESTDWTEMLARTELQPDTRHVFVVPVGPSLSFLRLDAFPDGGIARVRAVGEIDEAARAWAGYRWFNSLPGRQAIGLLASSGLATRAARDIAALRPFDASKGFDAIGAETQLEEEELRALRPLLHGRRVES